MANSLVGKIVRWFNRPQSLDSSSSLRQIGRDAFVYEEKGRKVQVYVELQVGHPRRIVELKSIRAWEPPNYGVISAADRERIGRRIAAYLSSRGVTTVIDTESE